MYDNEIQQLEDQLDKVREECAELYDNCVQNFLEDSRSVILTNLFDNDGKERFINFMMNNSLVVIDIKNKLHNLTRTDKYH